MKSLEKASFLGLGVMGYAMAGHLAEKSGLEVGVYNRTYEKSLSWQNNNKGDVFKTPSEASADADIIFLCVGNDDDLRGVLTGTDGVIESVRPDAIIVDHTTVSAKVTREMAAIFKDNGCHYIDAPVSGGQAGAENGLLTVMCGGEPDIFELVEPIISLSYAKACKLMGAVGAGQLTKAVNQICIAGVLQGLSEGLAFGKKAGLDMDEVIEVIRHGAAQSWQMENRGKTMVRDEFDFGFALDWMIKDLKIALEEGAESCASLELTKTVLGYYEELSGQGCGRMDTSALIKRLS